MKSTRRQLIAGLAAAFAVPGAVALRQLPRYGQCGALVITMPMELADDPSFDERKFLAGEIATGDYDVDWAAGVRRLTEFFAEQGEVGFLFKAAT